MNSSDQNVNNKRKSEARKKINKLSIIGCCLLVLYLCYQPISYYRENFDKKHFSQLQGDWGTFGDFLGGVLNPFISLLTLGVTGYIAYILNKYERERDQESKRESDIKSFMELYQFFISENFREVRTVAWYMLKKAIYNQGYMDFLVGEHYVSRYVNRLDRSDVYASFHILLYQEDHPLFASPSDEKAFLRQEALDRNKVDVLVNFFQLLSYKDVPYEYFKVCDFYYDTWRPVLYYYAGQLQKGYNNLETNMQYNNPPSLIESLKKLDERYFKPDLKLPIKVTSEEIHPIIQHMKSGKP